MIDTILDSGQASCSNWRLLLLSKRIHVAHVLCVWVCVSVCLCVLCMFCASFLLFYSLTTALSKLWLAKLVRGRSSEPTSTAPLSQMPRPSPHWRHHHHHHRHRHMYITFPLWHWRVGSLSALQVLNSLTTNKNRRIESTWNCAIRTALAASIPPQPSA